MTVICYGSGSQVVVVGPAASASPEILLEMLILEPHVRLLHQKLRGWGPAIWATNHLPGDSPVHSSLSH